MGTASKKSTQQIRAAPRSARARLGAKQNPKTRALKFPMAIWQWQQQATTRPLQFTPFTPFKSSSIRNPRVVHRLKRVVRAVIDPELHNVLELANESELSELSDILYGKSLFSPIFKSVAPGDGSGVASSFGSMYEGGEEREELLERLEARLLFLAADARSTVTGRRPKYRDVLLQVRTKLQIPCSARLTTEGLEAEIFLSLLQEHASRRQPPKQQSNVCGKQGEVQSSRARLSPGIRQEHELVTAAFKGGSALMLSALHRMATKEFSARVLTETARYHMARAALRKGGQLVATKMESQVAMLAAKQVLAGAARRYIAIRSTLMLLGPVLWGTFFADVVLAALGTDYTRVVRAIYALAQIRLTRTYGWTNVGTKF